MKILYPALFVVIVILAPMQFSTQSMASIDNTVDQSFLYSAFHLDKIWPITKGNMLKVALIDTGIGTLFDNNIYKNSNELPNGIDDDNNGYIDDIRGWNVFSNNNNTIDWSVSSHGSKVASTILTVAPEVQLIPITFIGSDNYITETNLPLLYDALLYADVIGADIIVMPFEYGINTPTNILNEIQVLYNKNVILLASIGNCNPYAQDCFFVRPPARIPYVFGIGAIDSDNNHWSGSPVGNEVDFVTYGVDVEVSYGNSTNQFNDIGTGTSFSVGIAGGIVSLLKSYRPDLNNEAVRYYLQRSSRYLGQKEYYGSGLPQLYVAMKAIDDITPPSIDSYIYSLDTDGLTIDFTASESTGIYSCVYQYKNLNDSDYSSVQNCYSNLPQFSDFLSKVEFTIYQYDLSPFLTLNITLNDVSNNNYSFSISLELNLVTNSIQTDSSSASAGSDTINIPDVSNYSSEKVISTIIHQDQVSNSTPNTTPYDFVGSVFFFVVILSFRRKNRH